MKTMTIHTESKQYPLFIGKGIRHNVKKLIQSLKQSYSKVLVITDETISNLYLQDVSEALQEKEIITHIVPNGEEAKSIEHFYECQTTALENGLDRSSCIIALGGGVVGDLAGFVAATYMRGISFIQMPTTLLAHDSSVGGKVAINHPLGKNMIGAFYQPDAVIYDVDTFQSLNETEWRSGFAEVIKHGLIWDEELFRNITAITSIHELTKSNLIDIVQKAIQVKADIVSQDEKEKGIRSFLNFGHTLGHAIEAELGYGAISHGEAVIIGIVFAMRLSEKHYRVELQTKKFEDWLQGLGYSTQIPPSLSAERLIATMKKDKKARFGEITMILLKKIGLVESVNFQEEIIYQQLKTEMERCD